MSERTQPARPRLLILAPSAYPLGGVASWLDALVPGLRARGWRAHVALLAGDHHDVELYLRAHPALGPTPGVANPSGSREGRLRALCRAIRAVDPELVLSVNVGDVEDAVARLRRERGRAPRLVVTQHGLQADFYAHLRSRRDAVDGVVTTNRLSARLAIEHAGVEPSRVAYAPYGVALPAPAPRPPRAAGEPLRIAWVGRLERQQKRVRDLVAICARLEDEGLDFRLRIAGDGPDRLRLAAKLQRHVAAGRVELLGSVPAGDVAARVYADADVLLLTSSWETGPIVAWEAAAAGVAIVSSRFVGSGLEGALRDGDTALLFPIGDAAEAASCLAATRDPERRAALVAAARREVETRYTIEASLDAWERALEALAAVEPQPARSDATPLPPSGRLDRWLGVALAESVRERFGIRHRQAAAGDEWPHVLVAAVPDPEFDQLAAELDAEVAEEAVG